MAEQGLDASQIGTVVEQMCGEAVTKLMRTKVRWQAGFSEVFFHGNPNGTCRKPAMRLIDEEGSGVHTGLVPVTRNRLKCGPSHRTNPLLRSLSKNADRLADGIKISNLQSHQFGKPQATRIKKLEDRFIPTCHPGGSLFLPHTLLRPLKKGFDLSMRQKPRKLFFLFWYLNRFYDVRIEYLANYKKVIEASQRRKEESDA